jgi:hypothetical protein
VLCKALLYIYGPLLSLTPRGLQAAAVMTRRGRYSQLTALDLTQATGVVTDKTMKLLFKALPHLQRLRLPVTRQLTARGLGPLQPLLPSLTALDISCPTPPPDSCILDAILQLTQLRELTLPTSAAALLTTEGRLAKLGACTQLSSVTFSDHVGQSGNGNLTSTSMACFVSCAERLPALVSLKLDERCLRVQQPEIVQQLQGLTALTKLHMGTIAQGWEEGVTFLHAIGGMASLRSLQLRLSQCQWAPTERGWLASLSLLTSLNIRFESTSVVNPQQHFDAVLSAVPYLPLLRSFQLSGSRLCYLAAPRVCSGPFACLAAASETLEVLQLNYMHLPYSFMDVIQQLTHLTSLGVCSYNCAERILAGLKEFTSLRKLDLCDWTSDNCAEVAGPITALKRLHTLRLDGNFFDRANLTQLCASLPQLHVLAFSSSRKIGSGLSALTRLTNLEVVDLSFARELVGTLARHLKAPPSLRRCLLSGVGDERRQQRVRRLLGPSAEVVFHD